MNTVPISSVVVNGRHRKDLGDLDALAESIQALGLLHPVVVAPGNKLVAGQRRLEACKRLGWTEIPATEIASLADAFAHLSAERDENTCREDMKPSEKVTLGQALEELERPAAETRKAEAGKANLPGASGENFTPLAKGATRDIVGSAVGMSGVTYQRAKAVVEASENPELSEEDRAVAVEAREEMDRTGKVTPAFDKVAPVIGATPANKGKRRTTTASNGKSLSRKRIGPGAEERRLEDFQHAYGVLIQVCTSAPAVHVPPLPAERVAEICSELEHARKCIRDFRHKIEEAGK